MNIIRTHWNANVTYVSTFSRHQGLGSQEMSFTYEHKI